MARKCFTCCAGSTDETNLKMEKVHQLSAMDDEECLSLDVAFKSKTKTKPGKHADPVPAPAETPAAPLPPALLDPAPAAPAPAPTVQHSSPKVSPSEPPKPADPLKKVASPPTASAPQIAPGSEFTAVLDKPLQESIGIAMVLIDENTVTVGSLKKGAAEVWNAENPVDKQIIPGDRVVSVNSMTTANEMLKKTREEKTLSLVLRRPLQFNATIHKKPGSQHLGMRCAHDGMSVMVADVREGPVQDWNNQNKGRELLTHDRIIEVNGLRTDAEGILNMMGTAEKLEIVILRTT